MLVRRVFLFLSAVTLASSALAQPQQRPGGAPGSPAPPATMTATPTRTESGQPPAQRYEVAGAKEERVSQTSHVARVEGRELKYTATVSTLPIRLDDGKVAARMFFVAYTKDGEDRKTRPISFLYNGGPGSATIWLHMGSFAGGAHDLHSTVRSQGVQAGPGGVLQGLAGRQVGN